jgi:carbon-monoxide dehydrogenase large subunit
MTPTITETKTFVGQRIKRKEDPRMITGTATYLDDIKLPGMHYAVLVRSPYAAAHVNKIDASAALEFPGVAGRLHRRGPR